MKLAIGQNMSKEPTTISCRVSISEAQEVMRIWGMRHLPVVDDLNKLIGILSDRDIDHALAAQIKGDQSVERAMTSNPYAVLPHTSIREVVKVLAEMKFGCAIVVNDKKEVRGIFTTTDALSILEKLLHDPDPLDFKVLKIEEYLIQHSRAV